MKAVLKNVYVMVIAAMLMVMGAAPVKAATSGTSTAGGQGSHATKRTGNTVGPCAWEADADNAGCG